MMELRIVSKKEKKTRVSGHYWVKWSLGLAHNSPGVWRMGSYQVGTGWKLIGDERIYYDTDFLEINENRIPHTKGQLFPGFWLWVPTIAYILAAAIYIFLIYKEIIK
jgi:hypothetical protein